MTDLLAAFAAPVILSLGIVTAWRLFRDTSRA